MRLLVVGEQYADSFAENLACAARDGGHEVTTVPTFRRLAGSGSLATRIREEIHLAPRLAAWSQQHVVDAAEDFDPDLVVVVDFRLFGEVVQRLRAAARAPVVLWFPDSPGNLRRELHVLAGYDALFFKDSELVRRYRELLGLEAHFLPEACNPRWHRPHRVVVENRRETVLVAGNVYPTRYMLIKRLLARGISVEIFGPGWSRWLPDDPSVRACFTGRYLVRDEKARMFGSAGVVLNSLATHEADGLNCRLFEAAASGAVLLTEWRPRLREFFDREEVLSYQDFDDLVEGIQRAIDLDPERREALGTAAATRAHSEHTYLHRLETLVEAVDR